MYKYLSQIEKRKKPELDSDNAEIDSDAASDPEMEAFAEQEIKKEMKRLNGDPEESENEEEMDVSYSEDGNSNKDG